MEKPTNQSVGEIRVSLDDFDPRFPVSVKRCEVLADTTDVGLHSLRHGTFWIVSTISQIRQDFFYDGSRTHRGRTRLTYRWPRLWYSLRPAAT